jgi:hypothetical protein
MTPDQNARLWTTRAQETGRGVRKAIQSVGQMALRRSNALITKEIYSKPEDQTASGKPKWRRTGQLAHRETLAFEDDGLTAVIVNETAYAEPRHEAGKPGRRKINPNRVAHWRDDMVAELRQVFPELIHQTLVSSLRGTVAADMGPAVHNLSTGYPAPSSEEG